MEEAHATDYPEELPEQAQPDQIQEQSLEVQDHLALSITAGKDAHVGDSLVAALVAGQDMTVTDCLGSVFVSGRDLHLQEAGGALMVVGNQAQIHNSTVGLLLSGGEVNLGENGKILMTTRQALAFGAGLGVVVALLTFFLRRLRK